MAGAKIAIVTTVEAYVGPPAAHALAAANFTVLCQSQSFTSADARRDYELNNPGLIAAQAQSPEGLIEEALNRFGYVDVVISNDIKSDTALRVSDITAAELQATFDTLLTTPIRLAAAAARVMKPRQSGSILFVTSGLPLHNPALDVSGEFRPTYNAARSGVHAFTRSLAVELAPFNIQVNAIAPFLVYSQSTFPAPLGIDDPVYQDLVNSLVPMRRWGHPEEIGALITFLVSGQAHFVSGQIIAFSGAGA